ncbi:PspC family transcriptional regulator [Actinorhabdospora filicis]|uniref:PspC family transcriptional regulator n=1 Tax=Actinorhabdospora filicis TaxID=1785913 RepID=A0A9W6W5J9_9ACTN|nr:PspC domain-containing protein [Actinorhabdospora filicis]GLZ80467.1 PspC family transcriptional regulator [Actinorhabdospora filicis]
MKTLVRPANDRMVAGVCSALANRFGLKVSTVRLLTIASLLLPGSQVIAYAILWALIPSEGSARTVTV